MYVSELSKYIIYVTYCSGMKSKQDENNDNIIRTRDVEREHLECFIIFFYFFIEIQTDTCKNEINYYTRKL